MEYSAIKRMNYWWTQLGWVFRELYWVKKANSKGYVLRGSIYETSLKWKTSRMENRSMVVMGQEWAKAGRVIKGQHRGPCGEGSMLCLDCGGGYPHSKNCTELRTCAHSHKWLQVTLEQSELWPHTHPDCDIVLLLCKRYHWEKL